MQRCLAAGVTSVLGELPGEPAVDLLAALHVSNPSPKVIVLALREEVRSAASAAGADAFASKDESPERLVEALRSLRLESERGERRDDDRRDRVQNTTT